MPRNRSKKVLPRQRKVGFSSYAADPYHHYQGGIVMIPLLACSLISLALSIERILFWTRLKCKSRD